MPNVLLIAASERELVVAHEEVRAVSCGVGPVEAALATATALAKASYAAVLHVGIAGGRTVAPQTVVIGSEALYCDVVDANATLPRVHRVAANPALVDAARSALPGATVLPIATSARVGGGTLCDVEAMEGFGVLRAAYLAGVPALEVRVISNPVLEVDRSRWQIAEALAVLRESVLRLVPALLAVRR